METTNLIDVFRDRLGVSSLSSVLQDGDLIKTAVGEVTAAYNDWEQPAAPPPKQPGELRPVFAPSALSPPYEVSQTLNSLLVVHSVAIVVPDSINYATSLVALLAGLEDAIDEGLVHILPERALGRAPGFVDKVLADQLELPESLSEDERVARFTELLEVADIAIGLDACVEHPDGFDLACRTARQRDWLRTRIEELPSDAAGSQDSLAYLAELMALDLPLAGFPSNEMLTLRRERAFDRWRRALIETIQEVRTIDDDVFLDPSAGRLAAIRERMEVAAEEISRDSAGWGRKLTGETAKFGVACAGGVVGAVLAGPVGAGAVGGGAYLSTRVVDWLLGRPSKAGKAARRIVAELFVDPQ